MRHRAIGVGVAALAMVGGGVMVGGPPVWLIDWLAARYPGCLYRVPAQARTVALTLDDGPDTATTPLILAELERHRAHATFFLITGRVQSQDSLVRRIVSEGHEIGNHFTRDRPSIRLSADEFAEDLEQAHRVLTPYGAVRWARPGSGWYSQPMVAALDRKGYRCALGSVYPYDAAIPSVTFASWYVRRNVRPGAILVLHDGGARGSRTARILQSVLPWLERQGYRVVSLSTLAARPRQLDTEPAETPDPAMIRGQLRRARGRARPGARCKAALIAILDTPRAEVSLRQTPPNPTPGSGARASLVSGHETDAKNPYRGRSPARSRRGAPRRPAGAPR